MDALTGHMKKISPKRKASTKLAYNSTFSAKPKAKAPNVTHNRAYWKRQADKWFSEFIRLRDSDERGMVTCVTCSHRNHWRQLQNGHWITRGHEATRYDERNCNCQCRGCNYNGGQHLKHATAIQRKYGGAVKAELELKGRMPCRRTLADYKFLADSYRARVERIKETEPGRYNAV